MMEINDLYASLINADNILLFVFEVKRSVVFVETDETLQSHMTVGAVNKPAFDYVMDKIRDGFNHVGKKEINDVDFKRALYEANNAITAVLGRFSDANDVKYLTMQNSDKNG